MILLRLPFGLKKDTSVAISSNQHTNITVLCNQLQTASITFLTGELSAELQKASANSQ
jgi:hypothetical protein